MRPYGALRVVATLEFIQQNPASLPKMGHRSLPVTQTLHGPKRLRNHPRRSVRRAGGLVKRPSIPSTTSFLLHALTAFVSADEKSLVPYRQCSGEELGGEQDLPGA